MKNVTLAILIFLVYSSFFGLSKEIKNSYSSQNEKLVEQYFEKIRSDESLLRYFFQTMPKGGDLHHHYSGSVYAETYLRAIEEQDLWVKHESYELLETEPSKMEKKHWSRISELKKKGTWSPVKLELIKSWSTKYYNNYRLPSDRHFFASFRNFNIAKTKTYKKGLIEIKQRAKKENVSYIETMFNALKFSEKYDFEPHFNQSLSKLQKNKNPEIQNKLNDLYNRYRSQSNYLEIVKKHNKFIHGLHESLKIDDQDFMMRYQNYIVRENEPIHVFKHLLVCFASANLSDYIVGVNIVGPEDNDISIRDYWLHMQMFKFFHSRFPNVKSSIHAGELTLGIVLPEELTWHIESAVKDAEADRIGHGAAIIYENEANRTLKFMAENSIPIEINLSSNNFILGLSEDKHPIMLFENYKVPILICTDDAGVLRTDLTQQYVILAKDYKEISYPKIKEYVYNSIKFAFIKHQEKTELIKKLQSDFMEFEENVINTHLEVKTIIP